jgi:hypothetical protein
MGLPSREEIAGNGCVEKSANTGVGTVKTLVEYTYDMIYEILSTYDLHFL